MLNPFHSRRFTLLSLVCLFEALAAIGFLLILPSGTSNSFLLGYSFQRVILIGGVFLSAVLLLGVWLISKNAPGKDIAHRLVMSKWVYIILFAVAIPFIFLVMVYRSDIVYLIRLSPVFIYAVLVCIEVIIYQFVEIRDKQYGEEVIAWLDKKNVLFWLAMACSIPLLFANAIKYENPMGFGGLYAMMAEGISGANFHLPESIPFYGPGGVPYAYPPLGLYLMALFIKLGGSSWIYFRFAPPLFSLLALVPLYFLAHRITKSKLGALVTTLLAAGSFFLYYMQTESGGVVRGLAFGLGIAAVYFLDRMVTSFRWRDAIASGIFFGLTILSHLGYAYVFAFWMAVWVITHPKKQNWIGAGAAGLVSILVALPWVIIMTIRYGFSIFLNASQTHGTGSFISLILTPVQLFDLLKLNLLCVYHDPLFLILVVIGLILLVVHKKFTLPVLFLLIATVAFQGERSIMTVCFFIIGYAVSYVYHFITSRKFITNVPIEKMVSVLLAAIIAIPIYYHAFVYITQQEPLIDQGMLDAAHYLRDNTPAQATYLSVFSSDVEEDEWFPYLAQREPVISVWGSEWLGTMEVQARQLGEMRECVLSQSLPCMDTWLTSNRFEPDYILMVASLEQLTLSLDQNIDWVRAYSNASYIIWEHR